MFLFLVTKMTTIPDIISLSQVIILHLEKKGYTITIGTIKVKNIKKVEPLRLWAKLF